MIRPVRETRVIIVRPVVHVDSWRPIGPSLCRLSLWPKRLPEFSPEPEVLEVPPYPVFAFFADTVAEVQRSCPRGLVLPSPAQSRPVYHTRQHCVISVHVILLLLPLSCYATSKSDISTWLRGVIAVVGRSRAGDDLPEERVANPSVVERATFADFFARERNELLHCNGRWAIRIGCGSFWSAAKAVSGEAASKGFFEGTRPRRGVVRRGGGGRVVSGRRGCLCRQRALGRSADGERQPAEVHRARAPVDRTNADRPLPIDPATGAARHVAAGTRRPVWMMSSAVNCSAVRGGAREAVAMVIRRRTSTR